MCRYPCLGAGKEPSLPKLALSISMSAHNCVNAFTGAGCSVCLTRNSRRDKRGTVFWVSGCRLTQTPGRHRTARASHVEQTNLLVKRNHEFLLDALWHVFHSMRSQRAVAHGESVTSTRYSFSRAASRRARGIQQSDEMKTAHCQCWGRQETADNTPIALHHWFQAGD